MKSNLLKRLEVFFPGYFVEDRNRKLTYNVLGTMLAKTLALAGAFLTTPIAYRYLGQEKFGVLMLVASTIAAVGFADFGVSFGLQNKIPELLTRQDWQMALKKYNSNAFLMLWSVVVLLSLVFYLCFFGVNWQYFFHTDNYSELLEYKNAMLVLYLVFAAAIPFSLVQKVQTGFQEGHFSQLWISFGSFLGLLLLLLFVYFKLSTTYIVLAIYGAPTLIIVINYYQQFLFSRRLIAPSFDFRLIDLEVQKELLKVGLVFVVIQIFSILLTASDNLIIAQDLGTKNVADFNVVSRFINFAVMPIGFIAPAFLPSMNIAFANNEHLWIRSKNRRFALINLLYAIVISIVVIMFGNKLILLWIDKDMNLNNLQLATLALYSTFSIFNIWLSYNMLSSLYLRPLLKIYPLAVGVCVISKYFLVGKFGYMSIFSINVVTLSLLFFVPSILLLKRNNHL